MITDRSLITFKASVFLQKPTEAKKNWGKKHLFFTTLTLCYCRAPLHSSVQDLTEHWEWKHSDSFQAEQLVWHFLLSQSFYPQTLSCISALTGTLLMFSPPTTALWPSFHNWHPFICHWCGETTIVNRQAGGHVPTRWALHPLLNTPGAHVFPHLA